ncbi:MAG TPA: Flp pilus assembly protein CpaB [Pyrinomonadaceae bacterium]|jgi:pilus assembly protein CpaB
MRNKRLIIALTGAVICGLVGVMLVTRYLSNVQAFTKDLGNVVVAKTEIPLGERITAEQLALAPIPNGSAPEGVFRKMSELVGRVAITPIGVREVITNLKLAPEGVGAGLSAVIPEGYRAMTVKVDDVVGVSGFIMPGSFVDVVAIIVPIARQGTEAQGPISKIVLQSIKVLASGPKLDSPENQREPTAAKAVTLQVTPEQAEKLVLAANEGKLQLVMRNYGDQEDTQTKGANKSTLLSGESFVPQPAPPSERVEQSKAVVKRAAPARRVAAAPREEKPAAQPVSRNSVELIEGAKRRDVEIP